MDTNFSVWKDTAEATNFSSLSEDITVDVAIIGGGITGITAAYLLSRAGKKVAVLEALSVGQGATGFSTGNLYAMVGNEGLHKIKSKHNEETMKTVVESRTAAVDFIEARIKEFSIDCDFKRVPWCLFSDSDKRTSYIEDEKKAAQTAGLNVSDEVPFPLKGTGFNVPNQAQFNPLQYTVALAKNIASENCLIFENTKATDIKEGDTCEITTTSGKVTASQIVMATHTPKGIYMVQTCLGPYREYAIAVKLNGEYPQPGIFWDMQETQHYSMRVYDTTKGKVLLVLGEAHKVGQKENNEECFENLEKFLKKRFDVASVEFKWAAQMYSPADGLPYIGKSTGDSKTYIATGFSADGLTFGTLGAMIISDQILGKENSWSKTYDASRVTLLASAKNFLKENVNVMGQYLKDYPKNVDAEKFAEVKTGEGKIMEIDNEKHAVYRDKEGKLHVVSAICTHMKCVVHWNNAETSWDCPCHGSRFTVDGEVIEGPAINNLEKKNAL